MKIRIPSFADRRLAPHSLFGGIDLPVSIWAKSFFALLALAVFFQSRTIYYLLYALMGAYLVHRIGVVRALGKLTISRSRLEPRLFPGERAKVELTVANPSRAPLAWVRLSDQGETGLKAVSERTFGFALPPKAEVRLEYEVEATKRGRYAVGPVEIEAGDPFGIERFSAAGTEQSEVLVYPRIHSIERLGIQSQMQTGAFRAPSLHLSDPSRISGVRDYVEGDSFRHVHWRASAHTGAFKVKKFEPMGTLNLAVALDLTYDQYAQWNVGPMSELAIETAASILALADARRQVFGLYAHCEHEALERGASFYFTGFHKGDAHLQACLEALAVAKLTDKTFEVDALVEHAAALKKETSLVWVAPQVNEAAAQGLARLRQMGFQTLFVHVATGEDHVDLPPGVGYARVSYGGDIASLGLT